MGIFNQFLRSGGAFAPRTEMRITHFPTQWDEHCSSQRVSPSRFYDLLLRKYTVVFYKIGLRLFAQIESLQFFVAFLVFICCVITKTNVVRIVINRKIVINTICPIDRTFPKKAYMNKNNEIYNILILSD
jgi:hypothetical protein